MFVGGVFCVPEGSEAASMLTLTKVAVSGDDVVIAWSRANDATFVGYEVFAKRTVDPTYGSPVYVTTDRDDRLCSVYGFYDYLGAPTFLQPDTGYNFFVRNHDSYGHTDSAVLAVTTTPNMTVTMTSVTGNDIHLMWDNPIYYSSGQGYNYTFDHYSVYRREGTSGSYDLIHQVDDRSIMSWSDTSVLQGQDYAYYIVLWDAIRFLSNNTLLDYDLHFSNAILATVPKLTLTSPNSGEQWVAGSTYQIEWDTAGIVQTVRIDLLKGGLTNLTVTASAVNTGSYSWKVPDTQAIGSDYRIKVMSTDGTAVSDETDMPISITGSLALTCPNGGERLVAGQVAELHWTSTGGGLGYLSLDLYRNGSFLSSITPGTTDDGSFEWSVPANMTVADDYRVRVVFSSYPTVCCESSGTFSIGGSVTVTDPGYQHEWPIGSTQTIVWSSTGDGIGSVRIELCNGAGVVQVISSDAPNTGSFDWVVPKSLVPGAGYYIRVTGHEDTLATGTSNGTFSVMPRRASEIAGLQPAVFAGMILAAVVGVASSVLLLTRRRKALPPSPPEISPPSQGIPPL